MAANEWHNFGSFCSSDSLCSKGKHWL